MGFTARRNLINPPMKAPSHVHTKIDEILPTYLVPTLGNHHEETDTLVCISDRLLTLKLL